MRRKRNAHGRFADDELALHRHLREVKCIPKNGIGCARADGTGDMRCMDCGWSLGMRVSYGYDLLRADACGIKEAA